MFKFLHAADVHLDSPLRKFKCTGELHSEKVTGATRRAFSNLIDLAIAEEVAFILIAGDLYDGESRDFHTGLWLLEQLKRLAEHKIGLYLIRGNHDAQNKVLKDLKLPGHVHQFSVTRPETVVIDHLGVAIHGQGFAQTSVKDDLSLGYPKARSGLLNIGLLHTSLTGYDGHEPYAPCSLATLRGKGYAYWALGHVHNQETLDLSETRIVFPGNTQGRHIRETGPKGCVIVTVDDRHQVTGCDFRPTDVLRWERCSVDATGCNDVDDLLERFKREAEALFKKTDGRALYLRIDVTGRSAEHDRFVARQSEILTQLSAVAIDVGDGEIWVEKAVFHTSPLAPIRTEEIDDEILAVLQETIESLCDDDQALLTFSTPLFSGVKKKLGEISEADGLNFDDPGWLHEMLASVRPIVLDEFDKTHENA